MKRPVTASHREFVGVLTASLRDHAVFDVSCRTADDQRTECPTASSDATIGDASDPPVVVVTARGPDVVDVRLLDNRADPFSNLLDDVVRRPRAWRVASPAPRPTSSLAGGVFALIARPLVESVAASLPPTVHVVPADRRATLELKDELPVCASDREVGCVRATSTVRIATGGEGAAARGLRAAPFRADELVLTSRRLGPLQLRYEAGRADTNILNGWIDYRWTAAPFLRSDAFLGLLLSWVLLSLGAPFWFDALKNLLKLRPAAAVQEEKNRTERVSKS